MRSSILGHEMEGGAKTMKYECRLAALRRLDTWEGRPYGTLTLLPKTITVHKELPWLVPCPYIEIGPEAQNGLRNTGTRG